MKPGDEIDCPHCGKNSFLSKKTVTDGWTKKGEILVCASCSEKIADLESPIGNLQSAGTSSTSALANFLNTEAEKKPELEALDGEKQFCRDCENFISHPFMDRCSQHNKEVNPMDDCPDFKRKKIVSDD